MPKRVLDFDALWASDKIASCPAWAQAEYAWLYGLADASGSFELTNLRVIWGRVAAVRKDLTLERLAEIFREFMARGLLFTWEAGGKRYGHWTGSDVPGRLPAPSWRVRLERLAPPVPKRELAAYMSQFSSFQRGVQVQPGPVFDPELQVQPGPVRQEQLFGDDFAAAAESQTASLFHRGVQVQPAPVEKSVEDEELKAGLEAAQGQEWDRDWKKKEEREDTPACASSFLSSSSLCELQEQPAPVREMSKQSEANDGVFCAEEILRIYERGRGSLPAAVELTRERRRQCAQRIRAGLTRDDFTAAVQRAAATPFLAGEGVRGWRASFDWLIANDTNARKVIEGAYETVQTRSAAQARAGISPKDRVLYSEIHAGAGPIAADSGVRAKPEAIERMRAREAARGSP
jgi:hypothetical protein